EARISGLNYAPPPPTTRGEEKSQLDHVAIDRAKALIQLEAEEHPSARAYHDLGRMYLAAHDFDRAVEQFERAMKLAERNPLLHSDLGAAYLEKAIVADDKPSLGDLAKALEQFDRALEIDDSMLAALFNKALCLQRMKGTAATAIEAWESYLRKDPDSQWSKEAEQNLRVLRGQGGNRKTSTEVLADFMSSYRERDEVRAERIQSQTKEMITGTMVPFALVKSFLTANSSNQTESSDEIL